VVASKKMSYGKVPPVLAGQTLTKPWGGMHMRGASANWQLAAGLMAVAFSVSACADLSGPIGTDSAVNPAIIDIPADNSIEGDVYVCKEVAGGSTESFNFWVTVGAGQPFQVSVTAGNCLRVHDQVASTNIDVTVQEQSKTGWSLLDIDIERMRQLSSGGLDTYDVATRTATVRVNNDLGRRIIFYNEADVLDGCSHTIGYWKTHAGFTGNNPDVVTALLPIWLGTSGGAKSVQVTTAGQVVNIMSAVGSNGISKLYAQLLGAKLSIADGADGSAIAAVITAADAFLATHNAADWTSLSKSQKQMVLGWMETLDDYNNGLIGPGHCDEVTT